MPELQRKILLMVLAYKRVNNKQWLCKDKAWPTIVKAQKARETVLYTLYLNSDWPIDYDSSSFSAKSKNVLDKSYKNKVLSQLKRKP